MKVAIVHYHLNHGGVSQVIATASRAMSRAGLRHVILVGSEPDPSFADLPVRVIAGLRYSTAAVSDEAVTALCDELREHTSSALDGAPEVWHIHNHALGKNPLLPRAVAHFANSGERLVLQLHDLAEDGRPENYRQLVGYSNLYPISPRIRYAFLNARDQRRFLDAGLSAPDTCILANPVEFQNIYHEVASDRSVLFAPARMIRRKNLGELLFLAAIAPHRTLLATSRAPQNPSAHAMHESWVQCAKKLHLPLEFAVVDRIAPPSSDDASYESWLRHTTHFVSTSVAEGFGMTFLESIAHGKPLLGRRLDHVAAELARHGIETGDLYEQLLVPTEWIDLAQLRELLTAALRQNHRWYGRHLREDHVDAAFRFLCRDGMLDFGNLPEALQRVVLEKLADPQNRSIPLVRKMGITQRADQWLARAIAQRETTATINQLAAFSPNAHLQSLLQLYTELAAAPASPVRPLAADVVLTSCLAPESFQFLLSPVRPLGGHRAVIFDIYGTLLAAAAGGVKPDPAADGLLREIIHRYGYAAPDSPSTALHAAVRRAHESSKADFPEVDLRCLWRDILNAAPDVDLTDLVIAIETAWHPATWIPGAAEAIRRMAASGVTLGLLSNAQCNTLPCMGEFAKLFAPELTLLSYQHGIAKPSLALFQQMVARLLDRGITAQETLFIGNDPLHDIQPAAALGFQTALFTGHADSLRPGECLADFEVHDWAAFSVMRVASLIDIPIF